jgi:hypothetical protein
MLNWPHRRQVVITVKTLDLADERQEWTKKYKGQLAETTLDITHLRYESELNSKKQAESITENELLRNRADEYAKRLIAREDELLTEIAELKKELVASRSTKTTSPKATSPKTQGSPTSNSSGHNTLYNVDRSHKMKIHGEEAPHELQKVEWRPPTPSFSLRGHYDYSSSEDDYFNRRFDVHRRERSLVITRRPRNRGSQIELHGEVPVVNGRSRPEDEQIYDAQNDDSRETKSDVPPPQPHPVQSVLDGDGHNRTGSGFGSSIADSRMQDSSVSSDSEERERKRYVQAYRKREIERRESQSSPIGSLGLSNSRDAHQHKEEKQRDREVGVPHGYLRSRTTKMHEPIKPVNTGFRAVLARRLKEL